MFEALGGLDLENQPEVIGTGRVSSSRAERSGQAVEPNGRIRPYSASAGKPSVKTTSARGSWPPRGRASCSGLPTAIIMVTM